MNTTLNKMTDSERFVNACSSQMQTDKDKTFYYETLPVKSNDSSCMFDSLTDETKKQITMLSCNCPKCTVR
jgi:hypothetical protein